MTDKKNDVSQSSKFRKIISKMKSAGLEGESKKLTAIVRDFQKRYEKLQNKLKNEADEREQIQREYRLYIKECHELQKMGKIGDWQYNVKTTEFYGSEQARAIYGFSPKKKILTTEDVESCIHDRERVHQALVDLVEKNKKYNIVFSIDPVNRKTKKIIHSVAWRILNDKGDVEFVRGIVVDITRIKHIQKALKLSEKTFDNIFNKIPDPLLIQDISDSKIIRANRKACEFYGYSDKEFQEISAYDLDTPSEAEHVQERLKKIKTEGSMIFETRHRIKNGRIYPIEVNTHEIDFQGKRAFFTVCRDLTQRKKTEKDLRESQRKLSTMISNFRGIAYRCKLDTAWSMEFMSNATKEMTGYDVDEFISKKITYNRIIHPDDRRYVFDTIDRAVGKNLKFSIEYRIIRRNGEVRWVWEQGVGVPEQDGIILEGLIHDISKRKKTDFIKDFANRIDQDDIEETDVFCRGLDAAETLTDSNLALLHFIDEENKMISLQVWSSGVLKKCKIQTEKKHYPISEAGIWVSSFYNRKTFICNDYRVADNKKGYPKGHPELTRLMTVPIFENARIVALVGVANKNCDYNSEDEYFLKLLSDNIWSAIRRKRAEAEVKAIRTRLKLAAEASKICIWEMDISSGHMVWDKNMFELYGVYPKNFGNSYEAWKKCVHPDDIERTNKEVKKSIKENKSFHTSFRIITPNNEIRYIQAHAVVTEDSSGNPAKMIGANYNMTETVIYQQVLKKTNVQLRDAKRRAEESGRLKSAFLANMSHEIRTPLNSIIGFSSLLTDKKTSPVSSREYSKHIRNSGEQLLHLINDIIDLSKIESDQMSIELSKVDVQDLLQNLASSMKQAAFAVENSDVKLIYRKPDHNCRIVKTDPYRLKQILTNLIQNAFKYTEKGSVIVWFVPVKIDGRQYLEFHVADTGTGIPEDRLESIFERFIQFGTDHFKQGTGLGLSIARAFVNLLGGTIHVKSKIGKGTDFYFTIPYDPDIDLTSENISRSNETKNSIDMESGSVMVAEDDDNSWYYIKEVLSRCGLTCRRTRNGQELLDFLEKQCPDVILLDLNMPEMSGWEALKHIRKMKKYIPVIAQTAYAMAEDRNKCIQAGCDDYVSKPVKPEELIEKVETIMKKSKAGSYNE